MRVTLAVLLATGCGGGLGEIKGFDLGRPQSAAWVKQEADDTIEIVATDQEDACGPLDSLEAGPDSTWTLWIWSTEPATYEQDLGATALVEIDDGLLDDTYDGTGTIQVDDASGDLKVDIDLDVGDDRLKGSFRAEACAGD